MLCYNFWHGASSVTLYGINSELSWYKNIKYLSAYYSILIFFFFFWIFSYDLQDLKTIFHYKLKKRFFILFSFSYRSDHIFSPSWFVWHRIISFVAIIFSKIANPKSIYKGKSLLTSTADVKGGGLVWFDFFNGISNFVAYSMPKPSLLKNSSDTI